MDENQQLKIAWGLFVELRKEILESEKIRAQIIGFKITFLSAAVGLILANQQTAPLWLLFIPALASTLFDFLINSYDISINRLAYYTRTHIEPQLCDVSGWNRAHPMWEEFMAQPSNRILFDHLGNLGLTALIMVSAGFAMSITLPRCQWLTGCALMGIVLVVQALTYSMRIGRYGRKFPFLSRSAA
jgi:hypothetical protein